MIRKTTIIVASEDADTLMRRIANPPNPAPNIRRNGQRSHTVAALHRLTGFLVITPLMLQYQRELSLFMLHVIMVPRIVFPL